MKGMLQVYTFQMLCAYLWSLYRRNDKIIIFSDVVFALRSYAYALKRYGITTAQCVYVDFNDLETKYKFADYKTTRLRIVVHIFANLHASYLFSCTVKFCSL